MAAVYICDFCGKSLPAAAFDHIANRWKAPYGWVAVTPPEAEVKLACSPQCAQNNFHVGYPDYGKKVDALK